jgi:hypothetical protein
MPFSMWQSYVTLLQVLIWNVLSNLNHLQLLLWIPIVFNILPTIAARPEESPFPDIPFQAFSHLSGTILALKFHFRQLWSFCLL